MVFELLVSLVNCLAQRLLRVGHQLVHMLESTQIHNLLSHLKLEEPYIPSVGVVVVAPREKTVGGRYIWKTWSFNLVHTLKGHLRGR